MALTEARRTGEFLISEGNGTFSREAVTVLSGEVLASGTVVGKVTASGKYAAYDNTASDGTQTAAGVLYEAVDATGADKPGVIIAREAEVAGNRLTWDAANDATAITAGKADLAAVGILVR